MRSEDQQARDRQMAETIAQNLREEHQRQVSQIQAAQQRQQEEFTRAMREAQEMMSQQQFQLQQTQSQTSSVTQNLQFQLQQQFEDMRTQLQQQMAPAVPVNVSAQGLYLQQVLAQPTPAPPQESPTRATSSGSLANSWTVEDGQAAMTDALGVQTTHDGHLDGRTQYYPLQDALQDGQLSDGEGLDGPPPTMGQ